MLEPLVREWTVRNSRIIYLGFVPAQEIPAYTCAADVIYYGFDPQNGMAAFSAPHKLFEALAAGKPLITGDFGEIADVVRRASSGIVLPVYTVDAIRQALELLSDNAVRQRYAHNALEAGRREMNWGKAQEILYREYSELVAGPLNPVAESESEAVDALPTLAAK